MLLVDVFDAKIIHDQGGLDWACYMCEQTRYVGDLIVARRPQVFLELLVGQLASLWKAVNRLADLDVNPAIFWRSLVGCTGRACVVGNVLEVSAYIRTFLMVSLDKNFQHRALQTLHRLC